MAQVIEMPKLSDTMETGTLVKWLKKEGDKVTNGDMLAEVETDKATMELENFDEGVILKHYVAEGDEVPVGGPVCAIGEKGEDAPEVDMPDVPKDDDADEKSAASEDKAEDKEDAEESAEEESDEGKEEEKEKSESKPEPAERDEKTTAEAKSASTGNKGERIKASPLARKVAEEKGVDLSRVKGTGPGGRIVRADVEKAAKEGTAVPAKSGGQEKAAAPAEVLEDKELKVSNMRKTIAKALVNSKTQAPHFYLQIEVDGGPISALRKDLNSKLSELPPEQGGIKFSVNDLILKASIEAIRRVPSINRSWQGDKIVQYGNIHLAFGVAVDEGLLTPVIRNAGQKGLRQISAEAKDLIKKARSKKLKPDEMTGSTLTVTNLGMYGISDFYGIINPPNAAILSVGATITKPVVDDNGEIVVGHRMKIGLSGDHRVIDGAVGALYLSALKEIVETPSLMLV